MDTQEWTVAREQRPVAVAVALTVAWPVPTAASPAAGGPGAIAQSGQPWWQQTGPMLVVAAGLAILLIVLLVARLVARERAASRLVEQRTAELSALNDQLTSANRALAAASRSKDEFLAAISHELRTPLTVISGFIDALARMRGGEPDLDRFIDPIARNVHRLDGLVTDLMTLVSLDAGGITPLREPVQLAAALRDAPRELAGLADEDVRIEVPDVLAVYVDPRHLERVTSNLLVNAVRHGAPPIEIGARDRGDGFAEVVVRDHGGGIPPDSVDEVFERFARGSQSASTPGTGLGLAIVRELTELNGGDVTYQSASPGARFVLRLPVADPAPDTDPTPDTDLVPDADPATGL